MPTINPTISNGANAQHSGLSDAAQRSAKLWDACCRFEQVFINTVLREMRKTVESEGGAIPSSMGLSTVNRMFDEHLADRIGGSGLTGVATALYRGFERQGQAVGLDSLSSARTTLNARA